MLSRMIRAISSLGRSGNRGGLVLFASMTVVNISNLVFQLVVVRALSPADYGALSALLGLLFIFNVPAASLQVVITRQVAARKQGLQDGDEPLPVVAGPLLAQAVIAGAVASLLLCGLAPVFTDFLHLPSISGAVLLAVYVLPTVIDLIPRAILLGEERFVSVSAALIVGTLVRLVGAIFLAPSKGVNGAMAASVLGALVTASLLLPWIRPFLRHLPGIEPIRVRFGEALAALSAFSGYWVLTGVQPFLARHFLSRNASGTFAASNTAASMALFLPGAIALVAFPRFAKAGHGPEGRNVLLKTLGLTALLSVGAATVLSVAPHLIAKELFGRQYQLSGTVLALLAYSAACLGLISLLMQYHLARRSPVAASLTWAGVVIYAVLASIFHNTPSEIAGVSLLSTGFVLICTAALAFSKGPAAEVSLDTAVWEREHASLDLTMVVPYFNPGELLRTNVERLLAVLEATPDLRFEIITVSDGSTDGSDRSLDTLSNTHLRNVVLPENHGKGQALRVGLTLGHGRYLGFIDADGDVDASALEPFLALVKLYEPDIILGSKRHAMSSVKYPIIRRVYSWGYQQLIRVLFRLNIRDTQTGLKLIRRDVLVQALPRMVEKRFAFDLELFVVARLLGFERFFEAPVTITHQFTSTVSWRSVQGTLQDTLGIFYRRHFLRYYDRPRRGREELSPSMESLPQDEPGQRTTGIEPALSGESAT